MAYSAVHLNGNLMCAIDIETSGLQPLYHDILQLSIVPVAPNITPSKEFPIFHIKIKPARPERADLMKGINKALFTDCINNGMAPETAEERLREWFNDLDLPLRKKIVPLGHNYVNFDRLFIMDWLGGPCSYDEFFRSDSRDTLHSALFLNDMADWFSEKIPFPKWSLSYLCSQLGVENPNPHDAVSDCLATIACYRKLMNYREHCCKIPQPSMKLDDQTEHNSCTPGKSD